MSSIRPSELDQTPHELKLLRKGIEARFREILGFIAEIETRLDQVEDLIRELHKKELELGETL